MEDRILRDSQKTQRLANDLKKRTHDYNHILTEVNIIRSILIIINFFFFFLLWKYEQLQANERDLLREMFNLQGQYGLHVNFILFFFFIFHFFFPISQINQMV